MCVCVYVYICMNACKYLYISLYVHNNIYRTVFICFPQTPDLSKSDKYSILCNQVYILFWEADPDYHITKSLRILIDLAKLIIKHVKKSDGSNNLTGNLISENNIKTISRSC